MGRRGEGASLIQTGLCLCHCICPLLPSLSPLHPPLHNPTPQTPGLSSGPQVHLQAGPGSYGWSCGCEEGTQLVYSSWRQSASVPCDGCSEPPSPDPPSSPSPSALSSPSSPAALSSCSSLSSPSHPKLITGAMKEGPTGLEC